MQGLKTIVLGIALLLGCSSKEEAKSSALDKASAAKDLALDKAGAAKDLALDKAGAAKDIALDKAGAAKDAAAGALDTAKTAALDTTGAVGARLAAAYATGKRVKAELDKVYKTTHDYDLAVEHVGASTPEGEAHAKELAKLPTVKVGDATIGYREDVARSVGGATYSKHFRASWRRGDKVYHVSYFTSEKLDAVAFAALLQKLVPVVEKVL